MIVSDVDLYDPDPAKCKHSITAKDTTFIFLRCDFLCYPEVKHCICKTCGKAFAFERSDGGRWVAKTDKSYNTVK